MTRPAPAAVVGGAAGVAERLASIRARIASAGADPDGVTVVAVTKGFGPDAVTAALAGGLVDVGENYAQELIEKAAQLGGIGAGPPRWHFLGAPQRNKIRALAPLVDLWEAVDRPEVVRRLAAERPGAPVLVEVELTGAPGRHGVTADGVAALVDDGRRAGLDVRGLMCVGPAGDRTASAEVFARAAGLARSLDLAELSMGMSGDFEAAVAAGSTMVRIGQGLFGPRPGRRPARR